MIAQAIIPFFFARLTTFYNIFIRKKKKKKPTGKSYLFLGRAKVCPVNIAKCRPGS